MDPAIRVGFVRNYEVESLEKYGIMKYLADEGCSMQDNEED